MVALRIGYFLDDPPPDTAAAAGERASWLSPRDAVDLVRAAVEATAVDGLLVVNGISANRYRAADLTEALSLGYRPQDDAWSRPAP